MNVIDIKFDKKSLDLLSSLIGKKMNSFSCEKIDYTLSVYGMAVISVDNELYRFTNILKPMNYFGQPEDVGVFDFDKTNTQEVQDFLEGGSLTETPVNQKIADIKIVNEEQQLYQNDLQTYDLQTVRGVIIIFQDGREISLEKDVWFSEMIIVKTGYNLINELEPLTDFTEDWENSTLEPKAFRTVLRYRSGIWEEEPLG